MKPRDTIIFQLFYGESDKKFGFPNVNKLTLSPQGYGATNVHHFVYVRDFIMFTEVPQRHRGTITAPFISA